MLGLRLGPAFRQTVFGGAGAIPPPAAAVLPILPAARWHPQASGVTTDGLRVTSATSLGGGAELTGTAVDGPLQMTDGLGRTLWRFEGGQTLVADTSLALAADGFAVFMVVRAHRALTKNPFFAIGTDAGGDFATCLDAQQQNQSAANLRTFGNYPRDSTTPGSEHTVAGSQMQVIGMASRTSGNGKQAIFHNGNRLDVGRTGASSVIAGATIGTGIGGTGGQFDVYDIVVYDAELSNAECASVAAALQAGWAIPDVTHQLVLEGDSITQGTGDVTPALNGSMILTEPGSSHIPPGWRVTNYGISGNQVSNLVTRRDRSGNSWTDQRLPGRNVVAFEIGRNDLVAGGQSAAQHYANVVAYLNTSGDGLLQRGWDVRTMVNISGPGTLMQALWPYWENPQFQTDTQTGPGQAYDGRLTLVHTNLIEHGGIRRFFDAAGAADDTYYAGDSTHPNILGATIRVTGGETPQYGVAAGV